MLNVPVSPAQQLNHKNKIRLFQRGVLIKMNFKYDIIIIHGTGGSPEGNWFQWLSEQLKTSGHNTYVPRFPTPEDQSVKNWCTALNAQAPIFGENTILIGHSCGATYLLHILEALKTPVAKSIFVSGFINKLGNEFFDNLNETFVNHNFDWEKIRENAGEIIILHGDDDPYVPMAAAQKLADKLQTKIKIIPNGGHLNEESGYTKFPELIDLI